MKSIPIDKQESFDCLCQLALEKGADRAILISASDVVIDERVYMKCLVPICSFYGRNLLCPPNLISVERFKNIANKYSIAMLIQIASSSRPVPHEVTSAVSLDDVWDMIDPENRTDNKTSNRTLDYFNELKTSQEKLYSIINSVESECMKAGYRFSIGFAAGGCLLCEKCIGPNSDEPCRHPFKARPSMEAMGIDVIGTAEKAGVIVDFSNNTTSNWFGLVFLD
jgi:predicted metal-binding protein